jgi:hypothetical protein
MKPQHGMTVAYPRVEHFDEDCNGVYTANPHVSRGPPSAGSRNRAVFGVDRL